MKASMYKDSHGALYYVAKSARWWYFARQGKFYVNILNSSRFASFDQAQEKLDEFADEMGYVYCGIKKGLPA